MTTCISLHPRVNIASALLMVLCLGGSGFLDSVQAGDTSGRRMTWNAASVAHPRGVFTAGDGTAEIYTGSADGSLVVANRFRTGRSSTIGAVAFHTSGAAAGDPAEVVVYEDPSGEALAPDAAMEIFRTAVVLDGGYQVISIDPLPIHANGADGGIFFVGLANIGPGSFSLGIDIDPLASGSPVSRPVDLDPDPMRSVCEPIRRKQLDQESPLFAVLVHFCFACSVDEDAGRPLVGAPGSDPAHPRADKPQGRRAAGLARADPSQTPF